MSNKNEKEVKADSEISEDTIWDSFWKLTRPEVSESNKEEDTFKWF
ncbi:hypothetical protein HP456_23270 [Bacillus haikouensis]|nr:hypothetical protein [Bacillus haikouensis]NQD68832.1 hypothetical protein [Bacillus haikouensis]